MTEQKKKEDLVNSVLICGNCQYGFTDCQCGEWNPVYLNEYDYLKHRINGSVIKVGEHPAHSTYFIGHAQTKRSVDYPKRLIRYYKDYLPSSESEYLQYINSKPQP